MIVWISVVVLILSGSVMGPLRENLASELVSCAELAAVVSLFILVCALETGGRQADRADIAS